MNRFECYGNNFLHHRLNDAKIKLSRTMRPISFQTSTEIVKLHGANVYVHKENTYKSMYDAFNSVGIQDKKLTVICKNRVATISLFVKLSKLYLLER